uniref:Osteocrin n=1 Tax=Stegastes partitus TaxID=144197 RepID=A0A3B5AFU4_9TELE
MSRPPGFRLVPRRFISATSSLSPLLVFQHVDRSLSRSRPRGVKVGEELTAKLLRLDDLVRMENDVMEPKRKRSFPGNNAPLDRLSISSMETKQLTALGKGNANISLLNRFSSCRGANVVDC